MTNWDVRRLFHLVINETSSGRSCQIFSVCEVVVVLDGEYPDEIGKIKYLNQDYWRKAEATHPPLDQSIKGKEADYEEAIDLHKTYGES
jgi:hypothetical protein